MQEAVFYFGDGVKEGISLTIKIKFDIEIINFLGIFDQITRVHASDCFKQDKRLVFVVAEGMAGKAVGKAGQNIKKLETMLKKKIKIVEKNDDLIIFVNNVIHPNKAKEITEEDDIVTITPVDSITRGYLIGREAVNLRNYEKIVKRYFDIKEIKVV